MGTPMVQGILFNTGVNKKNPDQGVDKLEPNNGSIHFFRVRAFHLAIEGAIGENLDYIVKYNHRKAWGDTNTYKLLNPIESDSFMAAATYNFPKIPGFSLGAAIAVDHGSIPSNAIGGMVTVGYQLPVVFK